MTTTGPTGLVPTIQRRRALAAFLGALLLATTPGLAIAAVTPEPTALTVANAMASSSVAVDAATLTVPATTAGLETSATGTGPLAGFPVNGADFAILSTGATVDVEQPGQYANTPFGDAARGAQDVTTLRVTLRALSAANNCLAFDYRFLSEEYPGRLGSVDGFVAELGSSTWTVGANGISAPLTFARSLGGSPISPSTTSPEMSAANGAGTAFDGTADDINGGATGTKTARTVIPTGGAALDLYLSIFDGGDDYRDSAVFLDNLRASTTATAADCTTPRTATLTLAKTVVNSGGGTATANQFTLSATGPTSFSGAAGSTGAAGVTARSIAAGVYTLAESSAVAGLYRPSAWTCTGTGVSMTDATHVTVADNAVGTCGITNTFISPGRLTLSSTVVNTGGGTASTGDFVLSATSPLGTPALSGISGALSVTNVSVPANMYRLAATPRAGYTAGPWTCLGAPALTDGTTVSVTDASTVACSVVLTYNAPKLTLFTNPPVNGTLGTATAADWTLSASSGTWGISGVSGSLAVSNVSVTSGTYTLSATTTRIGYTNAWNCGLATMTDGTHVTIPEGTVTTCTLTVTYGAPKLTLIKQVVTAGGGTSVPRDWTLTATGPTTVTGRTTDAAITNASVRAGAYVLSETASRTLTSAYRAGPWICTGGPQADTTHVSVTEGSTVTCRIVNTYRKNGTLTLRKSVVNTGGGTFDATAWTLRAVGGLLDGGTTTVSGTTGNAAVTGASVGAGVYTLSETGPTGYAAGPWNCTGATMTDGTHVSVSDASTVVCTITNTYIPPAPSYLTVSTTVTNTGGGTASAGDWTMTATGPTYASGRSGSPSVTSVLVGPGTYTLAQSGPSGYRPGTWSCSGASMTDATHVTIAAGTTVSCSITNTFIVTALTLVKEVDNSTGGGVVRPGSAPADWILRASLQAAPSTTYAGAGTRVVSPIGPGVYVLTQDTTSFPGYPTSQWRCANGPVTTSGGTTTVSVTEGSLVTCTNRSAYVRPTLALTVNPPVNNGGGTATAGSFSVTATGPTSPLTGTGLLPATGVLAGTYGLGIAAPAGYLPGSWSCTGGTPTVVAGATTVAVAEGATVACTITPSFIPPILALATDVVNAGGGTLDATAWTLTATPTGGGTTLTGAGGVTATTVAAGAYTLAQTSVAGYQFAGWTCTAGTLTNGTSLALSGGDVATCTARNIYIPPGLLLTSILVNDGGGATVDADWTLSATTGTTSITGAAPSFYTATVPTGTYTLSAAGPSWYSRTWSCTGGASSGNRVDVSAGASVACQVTLRYVPPTLALDVDLTGGTAPKSAWTLTASGPTTVSATAPVAARPVAPGSYALGVATTQSWWATGAWTCTGATNAGNALTVTDLAGPIGTNAVVACRNRQTLTVAARLTLVAVVPAGTAEATAWTLAASDPAPTVSGTSSISGRTGAGTVTNVQVASGTYSLTSAGGPADHAGTWDCSGGTLTGGAVQLAQGGSATCTVRFVRTSSGIGGPGSFLPPALVPTGTSLALGVDVSGGTAMAADWTLGAAGPTTIAGPGGSAAVTSVSISSGTYRLSRSGPLPYRSSAWRCSGAQMTGADTVSITDGAAVSCSFRAAWEDPWAFRGAFVVTRASTPGLGTTIRYWGSGWWTANELTRRASGSFRGYASLSSRRIGGRWSGTAAKSASPVRTLPRVIAVIVTDKVTKRSGQVTGRVVRILLVRRGATFGVGRVVGILAP